MNERDSYYNRDMIEINLKDLLLAVILYWKKVLVIAVIFAILAAGYVGIKGLTAFLDKDSASETREEYLRLVDDYERNSAQIKQKIEDIESELERQKAYRESSVMLLIDPYNVHTEKVSYFVDTNYEIAPSQYFQNPDYTFTIANAYAAEIEGIDFDEVINASGGKKLTTHNPVSGSILKLVSAVVKPDTGIVEITIYGKTDEQVDLLRYSIDEVLAAKKDEYDRLIGAHNLALLSDTRVVSVNKDFVLLRDTFNTNYDTLSEELDTTKQTFSELEMPVNNVPTKRNIAKRVIKYLVLGGVVGLFLAVFGVVAYFALGNKLLNPEDMSRRFGVRVLGTLNTQEAKGINRLAAKCLGIPAEESNSEYITSSLKLHTQGKSYDKIMLVGTASDEEMNKLKDIISPKLNNINVEVAGNVTNSSKALKELESGNIGVICVEKYQKSSYEAIESELQIVEATNHDVIGAVVLA